MTSELRSDQTTNRTAGKHITAMDESRLVSARGDIGMSDLHRQLLSLSSPSPPGDQESARVSKNGLPSLTSSLSLTTVQKGGPSYSIRPEGNYHQSRLQKRRQSEPITVASGSVMSKTMNRPARNPDVGMSRLTSTSHPVGSRMQHRRGTIAQLEGLNMQKLEKQPTVPAIGRIRMQRRGSLPLNPADFKTMAGDETKIGSDDPDNQGEGIHNGENGVNVTFYKEPEAESATVPQLQLADDNKQTTGISDAVWKDVMKCRYIRGYDPPEMRPPDEDPVSFVFGRSYNEGISARNFNGEIGASHGNGETVGNGNDIDQSQ